MRSKAPAILFTAVFALASGSALALGDRNKDKKATTDTTTTQSANTAASATPGTANKSQAAQNDMRCDESKYASRSAMPKECLDKGGTGASAVGSTQGQSGGSSSAGAGGASSGSASGASSSGSGK